MNVQYIFSCDSVHFCLPCRAKSVKIHGTKYTSGAVIRVQTPPQFDPAPFLYCQVQDIYVYKDYKIFKSEVMDVVEYTENLRAVKIILTDKTLLCAYDDLFSHGVLHVKQKGQHFYIIEREFWFVH